MTGGIRPPLLLQLQRQDPNLGVELYYAKDGDAAAVKAAITAVEKIEGVKATARHVPETDGISAYIAVNRFHQTFPYSKFFQVLQTLKEAGVGSIQLVTDALPDMEVELLINKDKSYAQLMRAVSAVAKIENLFVRFSFKTQEAEGIAARIRPFGRHDRFLEVSGVLKEAGVGKVTLDEGPAQKSDAGKNAWGKEVGGLQAGLGFLPGQHRTYQHGETVTLVVRVRNAGKETVKFKYLKEFFMAVPLAVEDSEGRPWPTSSGGISANPVEAHYAKLREGDPVPVEVNLPPGKETVLYELKLKLSPGYPAYPDMLDTLGASGKVSVHYWRLASPDIDANLSKLATGKLELDIKPIKKGEKKEAARDDAFLGVELYYGKDADAAAVQAAITAVEKIEGVKAAARHVPETKIEGISARINLAGRIGAQSKFFQVLQTLKEAGVGRIQTGSFALPDMEVDLFINKNMKYAEAIQAVEAVEKIEDLFVRFSLFSTQETEGISARIHPWSRRDRVVELSRVLNKAGVGKISLAADEDNGPAQKQKLDAGKKEDTFMAWGKEVEGLQAGIRLMGFDVQGAENRWEAQPPAHKIPQASYLRFTVVVRNVTRHKVKLKYIQPSGWPCSEDEAARHLRFAPGYTGGRPIHYEKTLQPGENWEVAQLVVVTRKPGSTESSSNPVLTEMGKHTMSCSSVLMRENESRLATGTIEVDIVAPKLDKETKPKVK